MDEATFWMLIEQAKGDSGGEDNKQVALLVDQLSQLDPDEIVAFKQIYDRYEAEIYREDVWDAAGFVLKGCSDSSFMDFRAWLIAQGEDVFRFVLQEPDNLAELTPVAESDTFGKYGYVVGQMWAVPWLAYEKRTGSDDLPIPFMPLQLIENGASLHVNSLDEREFQQYLKERYPRVAATFWDDEDYS